MRFLGWFGRRTLRIIAYLADLFAFSVEVVMRWRLGALIAHSRRFGLVPQIILLGLDSLPVIVLLAFSVGLIITYPTIDMLRMLSEAEAVLDLLVQVVALEIGPLLTAMVLIARATSSITMDLGNMELRREIEAVELLGVEVHDFFVAPRMLGMAISQLVLSVYFGVIALVAGIAMSVYLVSPVALTYLGMLPYAFPPGALLVFVLKNLGYGLIIGAAACFHALRVHRSPAELPYQARRAFASGLSLIFLFDGLIALAL